MRYPTRFIKRILLATLSCTALVNAGVLHAEELPSTVATAPNIGDPFSRNPVLESAQTIRNMVKAIGPEAAMDMMFSSIDPVCQKTLLSKTTDKAKAPTRAEEMRDDKYLQPAIAVGEQLAQWVKGSPDGRSQNPLANWMDPKNYWGWVRMTPTETTPNTVPANTPPKRY